MEAQEAWFRECSYLWVIICQSPLIIIYRILLLAHCLWALLNTQAGVYCEVYLAKNNPSELAETKTRGENSGYEDAYDSVSFGYDAVVYEPMSLTTVEGDRFQIVFFLLTVFPQVWLLKPPNWHLLDHLLGQFFKQLEINIYMSFH